MLRFYTSIADIRCFVESLALFLFEVPTGLIASGAGCALNTADNDLFADICPLTMTAMNTEVIGIIEATFVISIRSATLPHFLRDC